MKETLITKETAILAEKKGYPVSKNIEEVYFWDEDCYVKSTQSLLQKWLREVHKIDVFCDSIGCGYYYAVVYNQNAEQVFKQDGDSSYEDSLEIGLVEGLKLIKYKL